MEHHADKRFTRPTFSMLSPCRRFFDKPRHLEGAFDKGVTAGDAVMVPELFMEVSDIKIAIRGSVQIQDCLKLLERDAFGTWPFHAPVKDTVVAISLIPRFPALHGSVGHPDDIGCIGPVGLSCNGLLLTISSGSPTDPWNAGNLGIKLMATTVSLTG